MITFLAAVSQELGPLPGKPVGVGPLRAAASAARQFALQSPKAVVLVGTAGAYAGGPEIGSVIASGDLGWAHGVDALGAGYVPVPPNIIPSHADLQVLFNLPVSDVLTIGAITTDPALQQIHAARWAVEHMEAYGVALAAADAGVPFCAVLGITNRVGPQSHEQWKANRALMEQAVQATVASALGLDGPPMPDLGALRRD